MANNDSDNRYKSGPDFDEDNRVPILPISLSHSTELWLIQWPINQLQPSDFHGKELSLKLHRDGKLASFDNSSGKSYEVVSFGAQEPDATVFLPSSSDSKVVGKISRRVCLVRYPEPGEFDKGSFSNPNLRLEGSKMKALSHLPTIHRHGSHGSQPVTDRSSRETLTSCHSIGQGILETPQQHSRKKKHEDRTPASTSMRSIGRAEPESQMNSTATGSAQSHGEKKSKKRKIKAEE
ncbi:mediator-associated protein 2 [Phalaenopsis equestris]|uniref:mediator-associated protein 2 n=1 Tax=Phalaenopsis equestris TaxID=78828 RepID=UPI0009E3A327|nr:mediator-associated protein 2 [Phalaenopsis equestris]XP_020581687.1 mediator-associated protein 2 [Phalaenopsis equestris]